MEVLSTIQQVRDILVVPLSTTPCNAVNTALVNRILEPVENRIQHMLDAEQMGGRRPNQFLHHFERPLGVKAASLNTAIS